MFSSRVLVPKTNAFPFPYNPYTLIARMVGVEPTRRGVWNPSGYLSLTRLYFVEPTGYDPVPLDFQSSAMTTSAIAPFLGV